MQPGQAPDPRQLSLLEGHYRGHTLDGLVDCHRRGKTLASAKLSLALAALPMHWARFYWEAWRFPPLLLLGSRRPFLHQRRDQALSRTARRLQMRFIAGATFRSMRGWRVSRSTAVLPKRLTISRFFPSKRALHSTRLLLIKWRSLPARCMPLGR